jgi:hypothetical protein
VADYLAALPPKDVAAFYRRLAASIQTQFGGDSLAALLLIHWLDGKGKTMTFDPKYVRTLDEVRSYLRNTARPIFLSQKPTPAGAIGGVVPRIRGTIKATAPYAMHLEGNVEVGLGVQAKAALGMKVEPRELDALYALHGFTIVSDVVVSVQPKAPKMYTAKFDEWKCKTTDYYHWDPNKHITVPNPDYGSKAAGAIAPGDKEIVVYHKHAIRVENAGLAAPFTDESKAWDESDQTVIGLATVPA